MPGMAAFGRHLGTIDAHPANAMFAHPEPSWQRRHLRPPWRHAGAMGRSPDRRCWAAVRCRERPLVPVPVLVCVCEAGWFRDGRLLARLTFVAGIALGWGPLGSTGILGVGRTILSTLGPLLLRHRGIGAMWLYPHRECRPCRPLREAWVGGDRHSSLGRAWVSSHHACRVSAMLRLGSVSRHLVSRRHRVLSVWNRDQWDLQ